MLSSMAASAQIRLREATRHAVIRHQDSILAGRFSLPPDGNRLAVSFVRHHGKIYMLEGFDESTSWLDRLMQRS